MTSAQFMLILRRLRLGTLVFLLCAMLTACTPKDAITQPAFLTAPYPHAQLWAVVPFNNESGVSTVRTDRIADAFTEQAEQVEGLSAVPVNRVIAAMRRAGVRSINNPNDALALMNVLGVDGLIVGTISTYDAYQPLKLGAAVQLFERDQQRLSPIDPIAETRATGDHVSMAVMHPTNPVAQASGVFDASNHQVLTWLDQYATGRTELGSAYGKQKYLVSMELYTQFVAYRLLHDLLISEQARIAPPPLVEAQPTDDAKPKR